MQEPSIGVGDGVEGHGESSWCSNVAESVGLDSSDAASRTVGDSTDGPTSDDDEDDASSIPIKKARFN